MGFAVSERKLSRRDFLKLAALPALGAASLGGGYAYAREVEPEWFDLTRIRVELPRLAPEFDGYRLVLMSDIHADDHMTPEHLSRAVRLANAEEPDLVAVTGDFATLDDSVNGSSRESLRRLVKVLRALKPRDGAVAVLGNHDHWTDAALVREVIRESGMIDVSNGFRSLRRGGSALHVSGVDDVMEEKDRIESVIERLPPSGAAILLAHEPDFADESAATGRFDLQISGHSHGGQINVPLLGPPVLPPLGEKYPAGFYEVAGMGLYTNRGLGMLPPRVRVNCRPEITALTLRAKTAA